MNDSVRFFGLMVLMCDVFVLFYLVFFSETYIKTLKLQYAKDSLYDFAMACFAIFITVFACVGSLLLPIYVK